MASLKILLNKFKIGIIKLLYSIRARIEDWRLGRISVEKKIQSKYKDLGANASHSTDYRLLDRVFKTYPLKKDDMFIDVGCGEGRVLTYLYLRRVRNKLIGIELDADVAETARKRTIKCNNIEVLCANILDCSELVKTATAFYIFNPFDETVLIPFIEMIEENCKHKVTLYYLNDVPRKFLDKRDNWVIVRRDLVTRPGELPFYFSVYRFLPNLD